MIITSPVCGDGETDCTECKKIIPAHEVIFLNESQALCFECTPDSILVNRSNFSRNTGVTPFSKDDARTLLRDRILYERLAEGYANGLWEHLSQLAQYSDVRSVDRQSTARGPAIVCEGEAASVVVAISTDVYDPLTIYCRKYYYKPPFGHAGLYTEPDARWSIKNPHGIRRAVEFVYRILEPRHLPTVPSRTDKFKKKASHRKYGKRGSQERRK